MNLTETEKATEADVRKITRGKLVEDLMTVVADLEDLVKATADQTGERVAAARAKAEETLRAAKARLARQEGAVMAKTKETAKAAEDYVRANPWKTVGIAAGAGFVLCLLAARFGHPVIAAGERLIVKGGRVIRVAEEEAQKLFQ